MQKLRWLLLLGAFLLHPSAARADGFIDWLEKWSGPRLLGVGTDLHLFCATSDGRALPLCQRVYVLTDKHSNDIKHVLDLRAVYYWNTDSRFTDKIRAQRVEPFYHYRAIPQIDVGAGIGFLRVSGERFDFTRGLFTPISVSAAPLAEVHQSWADKVRPLTVRFEETYIATGIKETDLADSSTKFSTNGGEWNWSLALVYDFSRLR